MLDDQNELFIVVDENDNILEYRTRYDCHHDNTLIHRSIGIVLYNKKGEILLQKRSIHKDLNPGMYSLSVAGHVTKGQSYKDSALREMQEELGIQTEIMQINKHITHNLQESHMAVLFKGEYEGPFFPDKDEIVLIEFFSIDIIQKMAKQLTPNAHVALEQINIL